MGSSPQGSSYGLRCSAVAVGRRGPGRLALERPRMDPPARCAGAVVQPRRHSLKEDADAEARSANARPLATPRVRPRPARPSGTTMLLFAWTHWGIGAADSALDRYGQRFLLPQRSAAGRPEIGMGALVARGVYFSPVPTKVHMDAAQSDRAILHEFGEQKIVPLASCMVASRFEVQQGSFNTL